MPPGVTWCESNCCHPVLAVKSRYAPANRSRIHERIIALRFLGIILIVLRLEVSIDNVNITHQFQTTFAEEEGGGGSKIR